MSKTDKKSSLETNKCSTCNLDEFEKRVNPLIDNIKLSRYKRNILKKRYTKLVIFYENYAANIRLKYNACRVVISVGSMILPTLQTIQNNENVAFIKDEIFWAAIATSLSVMIANNLISMFSLDRRYIMYAVTAEKLKAIGWKYFELSDIFSNKTHIENWILFWNEVEKIKKLQVIAEFSDNDDKQHEPSVTTENIRQDSDSEYDSDATNTPRKRTPRYQEDNHVVDIDRDAIIKKTKVTFNEKFEDFKLNKNNIQNNLENNITYDSEKINTTTTTGTNTNNENNITINESNTEIVLQDLQKEILDNKKKD